MTILLGMASGSEEADATDVCSFVLARAAGVSVSALLFVSLSTLTRRHIPAMQYITILGRTSEVNDASYTDKRSGEIVPRTELLLEIPGLRDKVRCELPRDGAA